MGDAMREIDRRFELGGSGIRVDHRAVSDVDDEALLLAAITANAAPDVVMVHSGAELRSFEDHFIPLDDYLEPYRGILSAAAIDACRGTDGTVRAVPLTVQGFGWYYDKRLFSAAGLDPEAPPGDWAAFLAACAACERAGIRPILWGNNPAHGSDWLRRALAAVYFSPEEIRSLFTAPGLLSDGRFERIASIIRDLRDRGYLDSRGAYRDHIRDAAASFKAGEGAMYLGLWSDIDNWKDFSDALGADNIGFFRVPAPRDAPYPGRSCVQGAGIAYAVSASSSLKEEAIRYALSYVDEAASALLLERVGALLPRVDVRYPVERYPALASVLEAANGKAENTADDIELHYPDLRIKAALFRYDSLFFNTRELDLRHYLAAVERSVAETLKQKP
jgi:ABC-type glycerol-3-phosphate transport system substrate-binding protein